MGLNPILGISNGSSPMLKLCQKDMNEAEEFLENYGKGRKKSDLHVLLMFLGECVVVVGLNYPSKEASPCSKTTHLLNWMCCSSERAQMSS